MTTTTEYGICTNCEVYLNKDSKAYLCETCFDKTWTEVSEGEIEERYCDVLDAFYPLTEFGLMKYSPSNVLRSVDPTAYRCGYLDWLDNEIKEQFILEWRNIYYVQL